MTVNVLNVENWRIQRKKSICNFIMHYHYLYSAVFLFLPGNLYIIYIMNKYMDIHKQTHKTYALHTIISGFLPQVHFKKKKAFKYSHFSINIVIYYVVILVFVAELQSKSPKMVKNFCQIFCISNLFIVPALYDENFQTYRKLKWSWWTPVCIPSL